MDVYKNAPSDRRHDAPAVLVTGGSGFIGRRLVQKLAEEEKTVVCVYHHRLPEPMANVYPVCSDLGSPDLIAAPLRGVHTVVHLAWEGNFVGPEEKVSWNLNSVNLPKNIKMLQNLLKAMERAGTKRIVFQSAIGASRKTSTPYLQEKYLAEFFVLNSKIPEKIIIRSSLVCGGNNDKFLRSIIKVMQFPVVYPVPSKKEQIAPIHLDDITDTLAKAALMELKNSSGILELTGNESYGIDELFKMVSTRYAKGTKIPLRGMLGNSLLPLFERESNKVATTAKLSHFLNIGNQLDESTQLENPLTEITPSKFHSFQEILAENHSV